MKNLETACKKMQEKEIKVRAASAVYETLPWGVEDQPNFYNACLLVETIFTPYELLKELKEIEKQMGRKMHAKKYGPRIIDLDIITYEGIEIKTEELSIPHPRWSERNFVIIPLISLLESEAKRLNFARELVKNLVKSEKNGQALEQSDKVKLVSYLKIRLDSE